MLIKSELIKQEAYFINSDVEISCCYHNYLGVILFRRELISAALKEFEKVLSLQNNNQDAVLCIGMDIGYINVGDGRWKCVGVKVEMLMTVGFATINGPSSYIFQYKLSRVTPLNVTNVTIRRQHKVTKISAKSTYL